MDVSYQEKCHIGRCGIFLIKLLVEYLVTARLVLASCSDEADTVTLVLKCRAVSFPTIVFALVFRSRKYLGCGNLHSYSSVRCPICI